VFLCLACFLPFFFVGANPLEARRRKSVGTPAPQIRCKACYCKSHGGTANPLEPRRRKSVAKHAIANLMAAPQIRLNLAAANPLQSLLVQNVFSLSLVFSLLFIEGYRQIKF
jgi:hypothetical protein